MDLLKGLFCVLISFALLSCAKVSYLTEQGIGQFKIIYNARENAEVLKDESISTENKVKIKLIEKYKKYFYEYWDLPTSKTYSKTTIINQDAVTYLVVSSSKQKVEAREECFIFAGCFPYLGFFKEKSAKEYVLKMEKEGFDTYMRKVLAYSTLNTMNDPILSTFFYYNEFELAETIFHELFHTIFFVKNEVDLNENLANFVGKQMVIDYFKGNNSIELVQYLKKEETFKILMEEIMSLAEKYKELVEANENFEKKGFIEKDFLPQIRKKCSELGLTNCWPTQISWNNATFAAFMTYEKGQSKISDMLKTYNSDLKGFMKFINLSYEEYNKLNNDLSFEEFLLK